jgi:hypothetical protein
VFRKNDFFQLKNTSVDLPIFSLASFYTLVRNMIYVCTCVFGSVAGFPRLKNNKKAF